MSLLVSTCLMSWWLSRISSRITWGSSRWNLSLLTSWVNSGLTYMRGLTSGVALGLTSVGRLSAKVGSGVLLMLCICMSVMHIGV